jgi:hypothetical protein
VTSFLKVAVQEGGLDTFTDELTFTTTVDGKVGAGLTLTPVSNQFRLVSASANLEGKRLDLHNVKISFAFPRSRPPSKDEIIKKFYKDEAKNGWQLTPLWRAAYALCVVDARSRENDFKILRLDPPEVTCIKSTDAFFPRGDGKDTSLTTGRQQDRREEQHFEKRLQEEKDELRKRQLQRQQQQNNKDKNT